uniref:Family with sequence similarity 208, member B n=1 Tax=Nothobranchius furzeri TaxID=105023 RepID=A0A8C6PRZ6_NOTFU
MSLFFFILFIPGVLIPVAETSDIFQSTILAPLQSAYLYEESKQFFRYKSAVLVKNPELEQKYDSFRANRKNAGYSEDDLKESYGFLLFEDDTKANALGETGVLRGNSTCTTLGDPLKGVYLPMYSDCLDLNPWYHGKSGYIAIIRLTKGKVKKVVENYTQNFTEPTVGFDCHVSEHLPLVSAKTSSFLAFERTQYYIYELLNDGSNETALAPSAACPFAIVSFSYQDTKAVLFPQETRYSNILIFCHYLPWRGQLQIGSQFYHVDLRSTTVAHVPVKLPPVVKVDRVTAISVLRRLLPRAVFDTCCTEEGGFLRCSKEYTESPSSEVMQGLFVFPDSRVVRRDTKDGQKNHAMSNEILQLLPVLSFAEGEVEKRPLDSNRDVCEVLAQQMQRYATLINPGLSASPSRPSRELSIFPDQYDVGEAHKHLYSTPEWTNSSWQTFKSYFNKPTSFELPLSKVSEILTAGQEEQREDFDEDVYICLSSPEEAPASPVEMDLEDQFSDQQTPVNVALDMSSAESHVPTCDLQNSVLDNFQDEDDATDNQKMVDLIKLNETNHMKAKDPPGSTISDDIPAELIVSITSAERKVTNDNRSDISAVSRAKQRDFQFSDFSSISKMHKAEANSLSGKSNKVRNILISSEVAELTSAKPRQWQRRLSQVQKKVSKPAVKTGSVQTAVSTGEVNHLHCKKDKHAKESDLLTSSNNLKTNWRKLHRRKRRYGKPPSKNKKLRSIVSSVRAETKRTAAVQESVESTILMELEALPLKKKTERWDLKPVISECGRTLVPFGSVNISVVTKSSEVELQCTENDKFLEQMVNDVPEDAIDKIEKMNMSSEFLLSRLKSVLSRRKRKVDLQKEEMSESTLQIEEHCLKKMNTNLEAETSKCTDETPQNSDLNINNGSKMSVDPAFANYLGLTPRENQEKIKKTEDQDAQQMNNPREKEHTSLEKITQILQMPLSIYPRRKRIKMLKRHQSISEENVKKKWWLHFQTPACYTAEKVTHSDCSSDNTVRKTVEEKMKSACSSTDALNLLADLALSVSNGQVPPQPNQALEIIPKESMKCELTKALSSADHESVLHALLKNTAANAIQPLECPSPSPHVGNSELIGFISKEHNYSLPPSSSLLLDLPGATFQVQPLSGSTGLLNHHQSMHSNEVRTPQPSFIQEYLWENNRTPDYFHRHRQKFKHSRTFDFKDGSIQVTRKWQENYDFNLDSRFTSHPKDQVIIRALHGPCDFSSQDTSEEVRLIFHLWIGLFYSRSTSRFFQIDTSAPQHCFEEIKSLKKSSELVSGWTEHSTNSSDAFSSVTSTPDPLASEALDLRKKEDTLLEPDSEILDLSLRSSSEESVSSGLQINREMKNGSCIEVNIDFLPDVIDTDGVSADRRLDIIRKGDYLVNEKLLSQETKADSPDYSEYLNGDVDCCERLEEFQNDCLREEKLDMKKTGYSTKVDIALICKHVPKTSDSPVKGDCTSENIDQAQMHDQLLPDNTNHGVNNLCANPVPLKDESSVLKDAAAEDNFKTIENSDQKPAFSDVSACTQDESPTVPCIPNQNDDIETENKTNASNLDFNLCCNDQKQETSPTEREEKTGEIIPEHSPSFDSEVVKICVPDKFSEKTYSKAIGTNGDGEKNWDGVVIPFLREDAADDHVLQLDEVEKAVKDQETIPFIKEATRPFDELPSAESSTLKSCDVKKKSPCSTTPQDNTETQKLEACESMSDSRSATPTIDEKPFEYMSSSPTSCTFTNGDHETCQDVTLKCPSRNSTLVIKELSFEKILQPSTANNDSPIASSICGPHSDVKQRTLRLLESINDYISTGCDIPHQIKAADIKSPDPLNISVKKCPPTCLELSSITVDVTNQRAGNEPHPDMSSFSSQDLYPKLTDGISLPIKTISEEVPNVKLQMNEKSSTSKHYLKRSYRHQTSVESEHQSYGYLTSVEGFQDENKTTLHYKSRSHTHHAVMAVGLNKSVESQTQQLSKDNHVETTSRNKKPRIHITEKSSATSTLLKKTKKHILKKQGRLRYRTGHLTGQNRRNDFSDKPFTYEDNVPRGQDSIVCTIFNTSLKKSYCVLDQLSQRSLPDDPTQASIDQERLIFSEQMKNLLRKSKSGPVCQQNVFDSLKQSCNNPLIVNFSNLEEQEDSLEFWDTQYVRQKIMVDMTDRKCLTESTKGKNMLQDFSQETSIPGETAKISEIIAEGARMYETKMCDVCSVKKTSSRSKRVYCGYSRTKPRNHFDFCDQMKKELDKTFLSNLNAVVKKSSKTKYRFYLLVTSDDVFFKETKAYLDAESHTAVPPCEFFSDEDNPACLLIILRNEDIAEHICKIPHLLRLKMTPGVQFAGIDEPDDIVNLTYQELFTRGGFIMLDRAVLESLSLCNMKLISDILQELNRIEKWKWMMHYRDSRRLKENARKHIFYKVRLTVKCFSAFVAVALELNMEIVSYTYLLHSWTRPS